jgi:UDP-galactopyranose mutase
MSRFDQFRIVVVGSGFFGGVIAHSVANELDMPVLLLERRSHVGGNSFSEIDAETGIEFHRYGSHLFHTSNARVWKFVNRFSGFSNYRHRVLTFYRDRMYTMPVNLMTINNFFGKCFTPSEAAAFIRDEINRDRVAEPANLEEKAISLVGRPLYEAFVRGYTRKQWETDPLQLPANIISRLPVRFNYNDFYFSDTYEGLPLDGYYKIFERMLSSPNIQTELNCDFFEVRKELRPDALIIYTGPIDRFYGYAHGILGWRTLDFEMERLPVPDYQGASVVNYPGDEQRFTRIHEFKHLHPERPAVPNTLIMREYSRFAGEVDEPYYPIGRAEDAVRYEKYRQMAAEQRSVVFGGRLGTYRYLDMHQAIAAAMKCFTERVSPWLTSGVALRQTQESAIL